MIKKIKSLVIYGDSISTTEFGNGGYQQLLKDNLNIDFIYNHAISSSGMTNTTPNSLVNLLNDDQYLHIYADLVLIWHGTNDWYWGAELGNPCTQDESTFIGAIESTIDKIRKASPFSRIIYLTPLYRYQAPNGCSILLEAYENKNILGYTLQDYYNEIINTSKRLCFPIIDMRTITNFHAYNSYEFMPDNIHPSEKGYQIIADILSNQIKLLYEKI